MIHRPPAPPSQYCSALISLAHENFQAMQQQRPRQIPSETLAAPSPAHRSLSPAPPAPPAGLLTHYRTHCHTLLLHQPFTLSPARCSVDPSQPFLEPRPCIPWKHGTGSAIPTLAHGHIAQAPRLIEGVTPRHGHELPEWRSGSGWQRCGLGGPYKLIDIVLGEAQILILRTVFTDIRPDMTIVSLLCKLSGSLLSVSRRVDEAVSH